MVMQHFQLGNIEVQLCLGVTEAEQAKPQRVLVTLDFDFDIGPAGESDDLNDTLDYAEIESYLRSLPSSKKGWNLLESLHLEITEYLNQNFPKVENLRISLEKFPFATGSVKIS